MTIFPTQYSVLNATAVGTYIAQKYKLAVTACKLLIHNVSDTYLVETSTEKYIFKIYRASHRGEEEIRGEAELLNILNKNGASVAYTLLNEDADMLTSFTAAEGTRFGMLFTYAPGAPVYDLNNEQLQLLGKEMASLHLISSKITLQHYRKEYTAETTLKKPLEIIKPAFVNLTEEYDYLTKTTEWVAKQMEQLPLKDFSTGYCQYDFLPKNFHFTDNEKLTFFDFDFAGKGYLINDITTFFIHYFFDVITGKRSREEADLSFKIFIESYTAIKPVSVSELKSIRLFGFGFWMFYFGFHQENFDDWSNYFFTERFVKERVNLIKKWMEYTEEPKMIFLQQKQNPLNNN